MRDIEPIATLAEALQALVEAVERTASGLPARERGTVVETCQRVRRARVELLDWCDRQR